MALWIGASLLGEGVVVEVLELQPLVVGDIHNGADGIKPVPFGSAGFVPAHLVDASDQFGRLCHIPVRTCVLVSAFWDGESETQA